MQHQPRLWFTPDDIPRMIERIESGEPTAAALWKLILAYATDGPDPAALPAGVGQNNTESLYPVCCAVAYLVTQDASFATKAHDALLTYANVFPSGNLGRGHKALCAAIVHECCYNGWTDEQKFAMTALLVRLHDSFREVGKGFGDPHVVTNNHWGVSHAGAAIAAMAAHGHARDASGRTYDLSEGIAWARGRVKAYLCHYGPAGMYHEGIGYMLYPTNFTLAMVLASKGFDGTDYLAEFPNLRALAQSVYLVGCPRTTPYDGKHSETGQIGAMLSWNDAGPGWVHAGVATQMLAIAPDEQKGALRWLCDRLTGIEGDATFAPAFCGWFFHWFCYPFDHVPVDPNGVLARDVLDSRQGWRFFRNRFADGDDAILGCYAKATFVGGHQQDDAGSIRFMALGHDWIQGGGQDRGQSQYQSVLTPADGSRQTSPLGKGAILYDEPTAQGGVFGMELRKVMQAYAERYVAVDYSGRGGVAASLAVLDLVDDHRDRAWHWNLTFEIGMDFAAHEDGLGFTLTASDGATLNARFLGNRPQQIRLNHMPDSRRTYQGGHSHTYPGRPFVVAEFAPCEHLGVYVVMTVQCGEAPTIEGGPDVAVTIGDWRWEKPFSAAVPAAFRCGECGVMSRFPSGRKDFHVDNNYMRP